jgi:hypothetical protein
MNIYTVRDNLKKTIEGKQRHLEGLQECIRQLDALDDQGDTWFRATVTVEFLAVNLEELGKILADVEQCCERATEQSWRDNPDRMGGQFTQDEIDNAGRWI